MRRQGMSVGLRNGPAGEQTSPCRLLAWSLFSRNREMTRAPVLFRVDAGPDVGYEHLSRCLVYAAALQRRRRPAFFLSQLDPASLALIVKRGGNEWIHAAQPAGSPDDLDETVREIRRLNVAAVVVDAAAVGEDYLDELRKTGVLVVS